MPGQVTRSVMRRLLWPPAEPPLGIERLRWLALGRAAAAVFALGGNLVVFAMLSTMPVARPDVVWLGAAVNVPIIALDLVLNLTVLRRPPGRWYWHIFYFSLALEVVGNVLWLQLTGSTSSYYLAGTMLIILLYRLAGNYKIGLVMALGIGLGHYGVFAAEQVGWLQPASLFYQPPHGVYAWSSFRWAVMLSMSWLYGLAFFMGNYVAGVLLEQQRAVDDAESRARHAVEAAKAGRLSGLTLDGKWQLGEVIGRGGMGEVYQGVSTKNGAAVAVKVLHAHMSQSLDARERFRREALLVARLASSAVAHVPALHDVGTTADGQAYIVMELLIGEDLGAVLRRRVSLSPDETATLLTRVAAALDCAHDAGVVHRDLKPQNVLLVRSALDDVRLLDFGVARLLEDGGEAETRVTQTAAIVGTPGYLAPEQARASMGEVSSATDVFALGALVYRALTGRPAFPARHPAAAIDEALHLHPAPLTSLLAGVPADLDVVLALALAKSPRDRYSRAGDFARDFAAALRGGLGDEVRARAGRLPRPTPSEAAFEPTMVVTPEAAPVAVTAETGVAAMPAAPGRDIRSR